MKRAIVAAITAAMLTQGSAFAQESEGEDKGAGPAVTEPEGKGMDVAPPAKAEGEKKGDSPDQVAETYTVKPGDTLWDLSQRFLGNPWYWPKVWSYNPEIENPHWIYPGNTIRFFPGQEEMPAMVEAGKPAAPGGPEDEGVQPTPELADLTVGNIKGADLLGQDEDVVQATGKIGYQGGGKKAVLRQDGLVTKKELEDAGVIDRAWAEKDMLSTYDKVYVKFRNPNAVRPGERYTIYRTIRQVQHPVNGTDFGYLTHVVGSLKVSSIDKNTATCVIDQTFEDIGRGDFVGPWGALEKQVLSKDNGRDVKGVIVAALEPSLTLMGENHVVFIDRGRNDGVEEGNVFSVIRRGDPLATQDDPNKYPAEDVASIVVIDVKDAASTGLVIRSIRELAVGDKVEMLPPAAHASAVP